MTTRCIEVEKRRVESSKVFVSYPLVRCFVRRHEYISQDVKTTCLKQGAGAYA